MLNKAQQQPYFRRLKSFVLRQGRMTAGQQYAYDNLWSIYGIGSKLGQQYQKENLSADKNTIKQSHFLDFQQLFNNLHPVNLEIGFGMGDSLIEMASHSKDENFLGIEVHTPGVGRILQQIEQQKLSNLRIFHADAIEVLEQKIKPESLAAVYLFFPDPWHKRRHNKRRIVNQNFISLLYSRLQNDGLIHMATDWQDYAKDMLVQFNHCILNSKTANSCCNNENDNNISKKSAINLVNQSPSDDFILRPKWRPETKFERKGLKKGHAIWDLLFKKIV